MDQSRIIEAGVEALLQNVLADGWLGATACRIYWGRPDERRRVALARDLCKPCRGPRAWADEPRCCVQGFGNARPRRGYRPVDGYRLVGGVLWYDPCRRLSRPN